MITHGKRNHTQEKGHAPLLIHRRSGGFFIRSSLIISLIFHLILITIPAASLLQKEEKETPVIIEYRDEYRELPKVKEISETKQLKRNPEQNRQKPDTSSMHTDAEPDDSSITENDFQEVALRWQDVIKQKIESARVYPSEARERKIEGIVHIRFTLLADGRVSQVKVVQSSGRSILDESAVTTIHNAGPFPPIPEHFHTDSLILTTSLVYTLEKQKR